jgi:hypothetical protein
MSQLEAVARRVLAPLILGDAGVVEPGDAGAIASWTHKTALVAMLVSSVPDRAAGYGLPSSEYRAFHDRPNPLLPLPHSEFWIGRYLGPTTAIQQVTPMVVHRESQPEPKLPQAYLMTVLVGQLIVQGVRLTNSRAEIKPSTRQRLPRLWPEGAQIRWPSGVVVDEDGLENFLGGRDLLVEPPFAVAPWRHATELNESRIVKSTIEVEAPCGRHVIYYPAAIASLAISGRFHAFVASCECGVAYLIETLPDGAHFTMAGSESGVRSAYKQIDEREISITDAGAEFVCKPVRRGIATSY